MGTTSQHPFFFFFFFRAAGVAYGSFQVKGQIGATAARHSHNHNDAGSKPCLRTTSQLTATLEP